MCVWTSDHSPPRHWHCSGHRSPVRAVDSSRRRHIQPSGERPPTHGHTALLLLTAAGAVIQAAPGQPKSKSSCVHALAWGGPALAAEGTPSPALLSQVLNLLLWSHLLPAASTGAMTTGIIMTLCHSLCVLSVARCMATGMEGVTEPIYSYTFSAACLPLALLIPHPHPQAGAIVPLCSPSITSLVLYSAMHGHGHGCKSAILLLIGQKHCVRHEST